MVRQKWLEGLKVKKKQNTPNSFTGGRFERKINKTKWSEPVYGEAIRMRLDFVQRLNNIHNKSTDELNQIQSFVQCLSYGNHLS